MHDAWHRAFVDNGSGQVALDTETSMGDNPVSGKELNDLLTQCITPAGKLRIIHSTLA